MHAQDVQLCSKESARGNNNRTDSTDPVEKKQMFSNLENILFKLTTYAHSPPFHRIWHTIDQDNIKSYVHFQKSSQDK